MSFFCFKASFISSIPTSIFFINQLKQQYQLSDSFIQEIFRISGGYLDHRELDNFFVQLESEAGKFFFTRSSENNLLRIINSFFDRTLLIRDAVKYPHFTEVLVSVAANSNYLCDILVRDPELFYWVVNPSNLYIELTEHEVRENVKNLTGRYSTFSSKLNALRSFKRKELLRIGLKDLLGLASLFEITEQLSFLALSILDTVFRICLEETEKKYEVRLISNYCLIALGKLGGRELNYSSDTDLIVFFDKDRKYRSRNYSEYLTEAVKLFIDSSSGLTDNGYLYRIDFRLRPDGRNSPLCRSIAEYLSYYESRGEPWERQMLIKSDFVSGDRKLYSKFITYLTPFIYPSVQHRSPVEQVRKLKADIEKNLRQELNIKLSKGGIRDIEFIVQVLQLLNGGKLKDIRQQNTLRGIEMLAQHGLLSESEENTLAASYNFYRRIEHYLQLMNDRQTHTIPEAGETVDKMSYFLGFEERFSFLSQLSAKREEVRNIYLSIIPGTEEFTPPQKLFKNQIQAAKDIDYLKRGTELSGKKQFDRNTQNAFSIFEPNLYKALAQMPDPDIILKNLTSIIRSSPFPSIWYKQLLDEVLLNYVTLICTYSEKAVKLLIFDPALQDFLLSRRAFIDYAARELYSFPVNKFLFYLYVNLAVKKLSADQVSGYISDYCAARVKSLLEQNVGKTNYFAAAMGSFGSREMTFSSDLDLIFVVKQSSAEEEKKFRRVLSVINKELYLFKADCRLRPEGKGSQLVWEIGSYRKYIISRARVWELQALCRIKFISGERKMFNLLLQSVDRRIKKEKCGNVRQSVSEMRAKMDTGIMDYTKSFYFKRSPGGLTDIEFILQYLILCTPGLYNKCRGKNNADSAAEIIKESPEQKILNKIIESSNFLKTLELTIQNTFDSEKALYSFEKGRNKIIASYIGVQEYELDNMLNDSIRSVISTFNNYLKTR